MPAAAAVRCSTTVLPAPPRLVQTVYGNATPTHASAAAAVASWRACVNCQVKRGTQSKHIVCLLSHVEDSAGGTR